MVIRLGHTITQLSQMTQQKETTVKMICWWTALLPLPPLATFCLGATRLLGMASSSDTVAPAGCWLPARGEIQQRFELLLKISRIDRTNIPCVL